MKPGWKDAPEWAQWLAQDGDGWWVWYEEEPWHSDGEWILSSGRYLLAQQDEVATTLEQRPEN